MIQGLGLEEFQGSGVGGAYDPGSRVSESRVLGLRVESLSVNSHGERAKGKGSTW